MNLSRRSLGLLAAPALLLPRSAMADTPFTTFAFPATGAPTPRTMPTRLAEIHNVLDFGADPTGSNPTATTAAIQAAVDVVSGAGRGTVYFPLGFYAVNAPITFNYNGALSICFRGEGAGTTISGSFNGFVFDRHLATPNNAAFVLFERMSVQNGNSSGATSGAIRLGSTKQGAFRDLQAGGFICITTEDSAGNSSQGIFLENCKMASSTSGAGTVGLIIGGSGAMLGCDFIGSDIGVVAYGNGFQMAGNRIENCNTAYQLGLDSAGTNAGMSGFSLNGSLEGCLTHIDMIGSCSGGFIGPVGILGHPTSGPNQNMDSQYGLRVRANAAQACTFYQISTTSVFDVAGISIANATSRADNVFIGCDGHAVTGAAWITPTNAYTAKFLQCNIQPVWTFAQLGTGSNALEGDEENVSDSNTSTWGNTAAGSGSNHVLVRYNGSNWTVVGK